MGLEKAFWEFSPTIVVFQTTENFISMSYLETNSFVSSKAHDIGSLTVEFFTS